MKKQQGKHFYEYLIDIAIIVLGVLIAFYLTNWGNEIDKRATEKAIIAQIYFEMNDNLVDLKNDLKVHQHALKSHAKVQQFLDGNSDHTPMDSLMMDFYWAAKDEYIFPNTSAFDNLKSTGMGILQNDSLRELITLVYNHAFPRISKGSAFYPDINEYLRPYLTKNFKVNRDPAIKHHLPLNDSLQITYPRSFGDGLVQFIGYIPLKPEKLQHEKEFQFLISEVLVFRVYKVYYYKMAISNVEKVLSLIAAEHPEIVNQKHYVQ